MKFKIPNYLTIGRIIIVPLFVVTYYLPGFYGDIIPFTLLFIILSEMGIVNELLMNLSSFIFHPNC